MTLFLTCFLLLAYSLTSIAIATERFVLPPADIDLIGAIKSAVAEHDDTLLDIARRFHLGQDEIIIANPEVDRWLPGKGTIVILPNRYILPDAPRHGLVLNIPEMRIYNYQAAKPGEKPFIKTYPVSVGRMDWGTPLGSTKIVRKDVAPSWIPPASIREEAEQRGEPLPKVIPPGPDNPLGNYALRLGVPGYLIHSTNKPWGIGMRVTHGCLRMYPEHIEELFPQVSVGTKVEIINQPVKAGWFAGILFLEVHPPLEEDSTGRDTLLQTALEVVEKALESRPGAVVNGRSLKEAVAEQRGYPIPISTP